MTFTELGISFSLFDADEKDAAEYVGVQSCTICGSQGHCFELGIGCDVVMDCPNCQAKNGLDADDREDALCCKCQTTVSFPNFTDEEDIFVCFDCLRSGKAAITTDTELGMISWGPNIRRLDTWLSKDGAK